MNPTEKSETQILIERAEAGDFASRERLEALVTQADLEAADYILTALAETDPVQLPPYQDEQAVRAEITRILKGHYNGLVQEYVLTALVIRNSDLLAGLKNITAAGDLKRLEDWRLYLRDELHKQLHPPASTPPKEQQDEWEQMKQEEAAWQQKQK